MLKILAQVAFAAAAVAGVAGQSDAARDLLASGPLASHAIRADVTFLADDLLQGREPGTLGYDVAARYVATQMAALGLEPAGDGGDWYQRVRLQEAALERGTLSIGNESWASGTHVIVSPSQLEAQLDVEAPVVFVGFGLDAPKLGFDDYRGLDVRGKIVAYLIGAPRGTPSEVGAHLASTKDERAQAHGAIGVLALETLSTRQLFPWERRLDTDTLPGMTWVTPAGKAHVRAPGIRVAAALDEASTQALFKGARRSFDKVLVEADRRGARPKGFPLPNRVRVQVQSQLRVLDSPNVLGLLRGSDSKLEGEVVLMMAHLDHIGLRALKAGERADDPAVDRIVNGASDNAVGVAIMLEVARELVAGGRRPRRSILFFANTAEEKGLLGADYFAQHPTVPLQRIAAVLNIDMPLFTYDFVDVVAFGSEHSTLGPLAAKAAASDGIPLTPDPMPEQGLFTRSDHYALVKQGVPAIFFTTGQGGGGAAAWNEFITNHYHRPSDDIYQPLDWAAAARFARINRKLVAAIADVDERPRWYAKDFFGETFAGAAPKAARPNEAAARE